MSDHRQETITMTRHSAPRRVHYCTTSGFVFVKLPTVRKALREALAEISVPLEADAVRHAVYRVSPDGWAVFYSLTREQYPDWEWMRWGDVPPWVERAAETMRQRTRNALRSVTSEAVASEERDGL